MARSAPSLRRLGWLAALSLLSLGCGDGDWIAGTAGRGGGAAIEQGLGLLADVDRNGEVDERDDDGEEWWTRERGALLLPNLDDDDGDGLRDADDARFEGGADRLDLALVRVAPWPEMPASAVGRIDLDPRAVPHVRVFRPRGDGDWELAAGSDGPCGAAGDTRCDFWGQSFELQGAEVRAGIDLLVEGRRLAGLPSATSVDPETQQLVDWDGLLPLRYSVYGSATDAEPLTVAGGSEAVDVLVLRVAPWLAFGSFALPTDRVQANTASPPFEIDLAAATQGEIDYRPIDDWPTDPWTADWMQPGFVSVPGPDGQAHGMTIALPRSWGRTGTDLGLPIRWLEAQLGPDAGYAVPYAQAHQPNTYESFGNHEVVPPYRGYPLGRVVYGSAAEVPEALRRFYDAQRAQAPALTVDTSWLWVGHVDEVLSWVPAASERGWKVVVASPALAVDLLLAWQAAGHGAAELFAGREGLGGSPAAIGIDEVLADVDLMAWSQEAQAEIDSMVEALRAELELTDEELVALPVLFEQESWGKVAFTPAAVNALGWGDALVVAEPLGPEIDGVDALRADLLERLGPGSGLGSDGGGLDLRFADSWWYHLRGGQVHCASSSSGPPSLRWWEESP